MNQTRTGPFPARPAAAGVRGLNVRARRLERCVALAVIAVPFAGFLAGMALLVTRGITAAELGILLGMHLLGMIGISIGLHRYYAHGSFQTGRPLRLALLALGSMAAQGPVFYWAANHRRHHSCTDRQGDPHSPHFGQGEGLRGRLRGLWHAHLGWVFDHQVADCGRYIPDLLRDPLLVRANRLYFAWIALGLALPAALGWGLIGGARGAALGLVWGGLVRIFLGQQTVACINSICHVFGSTPFGHGGQSKNNVWVAVLSLGEGWHNNHHTFPYSAVFGLSWWQFDPLGGLVRALGLVGLVWDVKRPTARMIQEARRRGAATAPAPSLGRVNS